MLPKEHGGLLHAAQHNAADRAIPHQDVAQPSAARNAAGTDTRCTGRMTARRRTPGQRFADWFPVARSADVGMAPLPVGVGGRTYVVARLRPGA